MSKADLERLLAEADARLPVPPPAQALTAAGLESLLRWRALRRGLVTTAAVAIAALGLAVFRAAPGAGTLPLDVAAEIRSLQAQLAALHARLDASASAAAAAARAAVERDARNDADRQVRTALATARADAALQFEGRRPDDRPLETRR